MKSIPKHRRYQEGFSLVEAVIATAILSVVGVTFLMALNTGVLSADSLSKERIAMDLARSQMEDIKSSVYEEDGSYDDITMPSDLPQGQISIGVSPVEVNYLQLVTVTVSYGNGDNVTLECYNSAQ